MRIVVAGLITLGSFAVTSGVATPILFSSSPPSFTADQGPCAPGTFDYATTVPPAFELLQAELSWTRATGAGVTVAVVDSGIDARNAHLSNAVIGGINLVGDGEDANGMSDLNGHGTAIAGQVAARLIAQSQVQGLAPDARLLSVRVFRADDEQSVKAGFGPSPDRLAVGIRYAADHGAQVITVAMSDTIESPAVAAAVSYAAQHGSLVVASAGNATAEDQGSAPRFPAAYPEVLAVTATNELAEATDASIHGGHVEIAAPGTQILTSAANAGDCLYATDAASTSFATGYVSAAAALVVQAHPDETPEQWAYRLMATAVRTDPDRRDDLLGWGVIQPFEAITLLPNATTRGPQNPFFDAIDTAVRPQPVTVTPKEKSGAFAETQSLMLVIVLVGLTALGSLSALITMRSRRERPTEPAIGNVQSGGLLATKQTE